MGTPAKVALALAAVIAAAVLFVVLRDDGADEPATTTAQPTTTTAQPTTTNAGDGGGAEKPPEPEVATIVVRNGGPVGGVAELEFTEGGRIRFVVESDVADEVHLHGYDVSEEVPAGGRAEFDVPASIAGVFEVELEEQVVPLAEITVKPG